MIKIIDHVDHDDDANHDISSPARASRKATRAEKATARMDPIRETPKKKMAMIFTASFQEAFSLLKLILMSTMKMMRVMTTLRMLRMMPVKDEYWSMKRPNTSKKTT